MKKGLTLLGMKTYTQLELCDGMYSLLDLQRGKIIINTQYVRKREISVLRYKSKLFPHLERQSM